MTHAAPLPENGFHARALARIHTFMLALGAAALVTAVVMFGWRVGLGFAVGGAVSFLNFYWLKKVVAGVAAAAARAAAWCSVFCCVTF